jgi:hypothetical protein
MERSGFLTRFLKRFWTALQGCLGPKAAAPLSPPIHAGGELTNADEVLARFLLQKNHFKKAANRATPEAFMPPPDLKLSVYLVTDLAETEISTLGKSVLHEHPQPRLYGRANIRVGIVQDQKLKAFRDDDPPRHVNVIGWPSYADGKDLIKSISQQLAKSAKVNILATPLTK